MLIPDGDVELVKKGSLLSVVGAAGFLGRGHVKDVKNVPENVTSAATVSHDSRNFANRRKCR
jgi:hypothetical protein